MRPEVEAVGSSADQDVVVEIDADCRGPSLLQDFAQSPGRTIFTGRADMQ